MDSKLKSNRPDRFHNLTLDLHCFWANLDAVLSQVVDLFAVYLNRIVLFDRLNVALNSSEASERCLRGEGEEDEASN